MQKLLFLLFFLPLYGHSQSSVDSLGGYDLPLSTTLDESRMGVWQQDNYKIYVELGDLEKRFRDTGKGFLNAANNNGYADSVASLYLLTSIRYLDAADQLKNAEYGFDLRKLVIYLGLNDEAQNLGNSFVVESTVQEILKFGLVVVYYKGNRISKLKQLFEPQVAGFYYATNITIYYDDPNDYVCSYYQHYGW